MHAIEKLTLTAMIVVSALATSASAQDTTVGEAPTVSEDWVLTYVPARKATVAIVGFTSDLNIAARCVNGVYDLLITGLPDAPRGAVSRELGILVGDETSLRTSTWTIGSQRNTVFSRLPASVARQLAKGGKLQIVVPAHANASRTRYVMDLNPSSTAIEQTLTACGRPLVDPRDDIMEGNGQDGLPSGLTWERQPRLEYPRAVAGRDVAEGYVTLSCVAQANGHIGNCLIESEQPTGYNLGRAVMAAIPQARVKLDEVNNGLPLEGRLFAFAVLFKMGN